MYSNRFAVCVMVGGRVLEELADGTVSLPVGTEYTIKLFNKHDRRAVAKLFVDTENVSEGGFIVPAHGQVEIARRADRDSAFKFVELGSQDAREAGKPNTNPNKEMGLIEVHFFLEREKPKPEIAVSPPYHYPTHWRSGYDDGLIGSSGIDNDILRGVTKSFHSRAGGQSRGLAKHVVSPASMPMADTTLSTSNTPTSDGCTVDGNATGITYSRVYVDLEPNSTILKLFLQGYRQPVQVRRPILTAEAQPVKRVRKQRSVKKLHR